VVPRIHNCGSQKSKNQFLACTCGSQNFEQIKYILRLQKHWFFHENHWCIDWFEITGTSSSLMSCRVLFCFPPFPPKRSWKWQFSDSEILEKPELLVINRAKYLLNIATSKVDHWVFYTKFSYGQSKNMSTLYLFHNQIGTKVI
jgi:hypothetical protein